MYRYEGCGLPNVYLSNGYEKISSPYGEAVVIHDLPGLHRALGTAIAFGKSPLSPAEFKFLRQELQLSQAMLAKMLGRDEQAVARWEKGKSKKVDPTAERMLRIIYQQSIDENSSFAPFIALLKELDATPPSPRKLVASERNESWTAKSKAA